MLGLIEDVHGKVSAVYADRPKDPSNAEPADDRTEDASGKVMMIKGDRDGSWFSSGKIVGGPIKDNVISGGAEAIELGARVSTKVHLCQGKIVPLEDVDDDTLAALRDQMPAGRYVAEMERRAKTAEDLARAALKAADAPAYGRFLDAARIAVRREIDAGRKRK